MSMFNFIFCVFHWSHVCSYKRFKLSNDKDFSTLFFPEKGDILKLLDHFENKTGEALSAQAHTNTTVYTNTRYDRYSFQAHATIGRGARFCVWGSSLCSAPLPSTTFGKNKVLGIGTRWTIKRKLFSHLKKESSVIYTIFNTIWGSGALPSRNRFSWKERASLYRSTTHSQPRTLLNIAGILFRPFTIGHELE